MTSRTKNPPVAVVHFDVAEVMETVAHDSDGVEPDEAQAIRWLTKHREALEDAMHYFARNWLLEHWWEDK